MSPPYVLTFEEREHFLAHGWIKITNAFTKDQAKTATKDVWTRLGMSETDKSTWEQWRVHMPNHVEFDAAEFAPRAWAAITELCGGEERLAPAARLWRDSFIVSLGTPEGEGKPVTPQQLDNFHVDGDTFVHYLDSPEQGLLVIPLFSDIEADAGGTVICPEAIPVLAKHLHDHPEGVSPRMTPRGGPDFAQEQNLDWFNAVGRGCSHFVEATGQVGDIYLLHPLMLHSASTNAKRNVRIITNPPVALSKPFCFDREDGDYSPVEQVTLRALGKTRLPGWKITAPREGVVPERVRIQERMKKEELQRLEELRAKGGVAEN
ncbi:hypothetical protein B0H63DRAFT_453048 [Podospora didyma]|uniref:Phytanoyl-CoA dioxygenase n=1 Tax=Podospora didyma TaxID=330526 RepID=A0AAE0NAB2_9PEZI|nr:hypothetical protein B0H63DRAFT_453048 [Podospora didyma]